MIFHMAGVVFPDLTAPSKSTKRSVAFNSSACGRFQRRMMVRSVTWVVADGDVLEGGLEFGADLEDSTVEGSPVAGELPELGADFDDGPFFVRFDGVAERALIGHWGG